MNTISNSDYHTILHQSALHCLDCLNRCRRNKDYWGVEFFANIYAQIITDLTAKHIKQATDDCLTDEQLDYVYNGKPSCVNANGELSRYPESE